MFLEVFATVQRELVDVSTISQIAQECLSTSSLGALHNQYVGIQQLTPL